MSATDSTGCSEGLDSGSEGTGGGGRGGTAGAGASLWAPPAALWAPVATGGGISASFTDLPFFTAASIVCRVCTG